MLEKRDQRRGYRHQLHRTDIHVVDPLALDGDEVAAGAGDDPLLDQVPLVVELGVGLGDDVALLLPSGQKPGVGLGLDTLLVAPLELGVGGIELVAGDDLTQLVWPVADPDDPVMVDDPTVLDPLVGTFDESVLVDPRIGRQRGDETDVRAFRRLDGTDTPVVRGMNITHFETRPLTGEPAGPES